MLIDWSGEFDAYLDRLEEAARTDPEQRERLDLLLAELQVLEELDAPPSEETATLKRVRQSRRFPLWRVSHPFRQGIAVRLIVWFTDDNRMVVALFAGDKARMGDVFYDSVGPRADAAVQAWLMQTKDERGER